MQALEWKNAWSRSGKHMRKSSWTTTMAISTLLCVILGLFYGLMSQPNTKPRFTLLHQRVANVDVLQTADFEMTYPK